jgi:hypothetical protein
MTLNKKLVDFIPTAARRPRRIDNGAVMRSNKIIRANDL